MCKAMPELITRRSNCMRKCSAHQPRDCRLPIATYFLTAAFVFLAVGEVAAQDHVQGALAGQNSDKPVNIQAETLEILDKVKTATFSGNVQVTQGDTVMKCRSLIVFYGPDDGVGAATAVPAAPRSAENQDAPAMPQGGSIRRAEARGDVTVVTKDQNASGDLGIYDMKTKKITLVGNVVVSQGKNVLRAERVVVNTVTGDARVDSGTTARDRMETGVPTRDRVRVLITPAKDAKGAPTNTMSFDAPSHPK
jgi:lipopolysaccharide export system protein LptA